MLFTYVCVFSILCFFKKKNNPGDKKIMIPAKKDQLVNFVEKVWGHEEWIVNNELYCGKKLFVKKGGGG